MESMHLIRHIQSKYKDTHNSTIESYTWSRDHFGVHKTSVPQLTRLTPQQMDEIIAKGLCFNCDNKYIKGHKCSEKKLFYIDCEEEKNQELEPSQDLDLEDIAPIISCHALVGISTPKTLKIQGYIKNKNKK